MYKRQVLISVCNKNFWKEVIKVFLKSTKKLSSLRYLISFSWTGNCVARYTIRLIRDLIDDYDEIVLYSYWLHQQAYVAAYLKGKLPKVLKAVSRCHRFDVYEYLNYEYIPYRDYLLKRLDDIYCISEDSMRYLNIKYPKYSQKYKIARLGTKSYKLHKYKPNPDLLRVVSLSLIHIYVYKRQDEYSGTITTTSKTLSIRQVAAFLFWTTLAANVYEILNQVIFVIRNSYIESYLSYGGVGIIVSRLASVNKIAFFLFLATNPPKQQAKQPIIIWTILNMVSLLSLIHI